MYRIQITHGNVEKTIDIDTAGFNAALEYLQDRTLLGGPVVVKCIDAEKPAAPEGWVFHSYLETLEVCEPPTGQWDQEYYGYIRTDGHVFMKLPGSNHGWAAAAKFVEPGVRYIGQYLYDGGLTVEEYDEDLVSALSSGVEKFRDFKLLERADFAEVDWVGYTTFTIPVEVTDKSYRIYRRGARSLVLLFWGGICGAAGIFIVQFDPV